MEKREMLYEGKAKQVFLTDDPDLIVIHYKDDASAYNNVKKATIEGKGPLNNQISTIIFKYLMEHGIPTHFVEQLGERDQLCRRVTIFPIEVIVRNVILMYQHAEDKRKVCHWSARLAAYDAGKRRMVPIFLTTATTAVGVVPMMLGSSTFWAPVGVTIFAGGIGSLILVVTILPVLYSKIYK